MLVDEADALLAGLWRDEHDDAYVVLVGSRLDALQIVVEGQVGNNDTTDTTLYTRLAKLLNAVLHDGIEITHQHQGNGDLFLDGLQLLEKQTQTHTILQGCCGCFLDNRSVGHRIAEGYADFYHADTSILHSQNGIGSTVKGGGSCTEI